jgi:hypothetical protein
MTKKIIISCLVIFIYTYFIYNPILIQVSPDISNSLTYDEFRKGDRINVFNSFNFDDGNYWRASVIINERDEISAKVPYGKYLTTKNVKLIKKLNAVGLKFTDSDMATVLNELILYRNDTIVFRSNIVLDSNKEGLQNYKYGWLEVDKNQFSSIITDFKVTYLPVVWW